jgi:hypothetical protein
VPALAVEVNSLFRVWVRIGCACFRGGDGLTVFGTISASGRRRSPDLRLCLLRGRRRPRNAQSASGAATVLQSSAQSSSGAATASHCLRHNLLRGAVTVTDLRHNLLQGAAVAQSSAQSASGAATVARSSAQSSSGRRRSHSLQHNLLQGGGGGHYNLLQGRRWSRPVEWKATGCRWVWSLWRRPVGGV